MRSLTRAEVLAAGHTLNPVLLDKISEADRRWFKNHPGRNFRMRKPMNGEPPGSLMIVEQIEPGLRIRRSLRTFGVGPLPPDNDETLSRILELVTNGRPAFMDGDKVVTLDELPGTGVPLQ